MPPPRRSPKYSAASFPEFEHGFVLPPKIRPIRSMPEVRTCLTSAVYLASQIELAEGSVHLRVDSVRATYFRAALAELIRTEDLSKAYGKPLLFKQSDDPLLHSIKLLRNYGVHIGAFTLAAGSVRVRWGKSEGIYESFVVDNLSLTELRRLDSAASYSDRQLAELLALFDEHQRRFGVVQLLFNTATHIAKLFA